MGFGTFIREKREQANVPMNEFARSLGISPAYWSRIERELEKLIEVREAFLAYIDASVPKDKNGIAFCFFLNDGFAVFRFFTCHFLPFSSKN